MKFSKFFSNIQEAPWYRSFLNPVIDAVDGNGRLLDIGTGSGKMIQILSVEKGLKCVGGDTNADMLAEAETKLCNTDAKLVEILPGAKLPFENDSFDYVTICSVLFLLKREAIDDMLNDARQLLKEGGKIIVLTPTGNGGLLKLTRRFFSLKNKSVYVWYRATKGNARRWMAENYLAEYVSREKLMYKREVVMDGFAQIEVIWR
ncbi:MAG TPA: class I SAM-dependent methyltransferase [Bacteroidetes bacterium]|nr:class I SAM-dependent methyltransferase [Bacteroidota bacterium]